MSFPPRHNTALISGGLDCLMTNDLQFAKQRNYDPLNQNEKHVQSIPPEWNGAIGALLRLHVDHFLFVHQRFHKNYAFQAIAFANYHQGPLDFWSEDKYSSPLPGQL
jgi:hypothetical protein